MWQTFTVPVAVVLIASLAAALMDLWKFRVYNFLTLPLVLSGIIFYSVTEGLSGLTTSVLGATFGLSILIPFCLLGGMGAGDVKLMAGVGDWLGMPVTFFVFLLSGLAAGLYAVLLIVIRGRVRETWLNLQIMWHRLAAVGRYLAAEDQIEIAVNRPERRLHLIPFGAMVALGVVTLLLWAWSGEKP